MKSRDKNRESIGRTLRQLRVDRRWSQAQLAQRIGVSQSHLSDIERGQRSLTAEQFLDILRLFKVTARKFASEPAPSAETDIRGALARLGAVHLQENEWVLPSERLEEVHAVVREVLVSPSPRLVTALGPVIARNADQVNLSKVNARLAEIGLERRLGWLADNLKEAVHAQLWRTPPREWANRYRRTEVMLDAFLARHRAPADVHALSVDILDAGIRSKKTLDEVAAENSSISQRWGVVTSLQTQDFIDALEAVHVRN